MYLIRSGLTAILVVALVIGCGVSRDVDWSRIQNDLDHGRFEKASARINSLIEQDSVSAAAYYGRGLIHEYHGYLWDAEIQYFEALAADSNFYPAMEKVINLSIDLNLLDLAFPVAQRLTMIRGDQPETFLLSACLDMEVNQMDSARIAIEKAAALGADPNDIILYRAELEMRSYDSAKIAAALNQLSNFTASSDRQKSHAARLYKYMNLDGYKNFLKADDDNLWLRVQLAEYLLDDRYCTESQNICDSIISQHPEFGPAYLVAAECLGVIKHGYQGRLKMQEFIDLNNKSAYGLLKRAEYAARFIGDFEAMEEYDLAFSLAVNQEYPQEYLYPLYLDMQRTCLEANELLLPKENLPYGEMLDNGDKRSEIIRASMMIHFDEVRDSVRVLVDRKVGKNLGNRPWMELAAWHYFYSRRPDSAEILYHILIEMPQPREDYFLSLIDIYRVTGRLNSADSLAKVLPWRFRNSRCLLEKMLELNQRYERNDRKTNFAEKLYGKSNAYLPYVLSRAEGYIGQNKPEMALMILKEYRDSYSEDAEGWYQYALYALNHGDPEETLHCGEHLQSVDSSNGLAFELKGLYFEQKDMIDSAMSYFRRAIKLNLPSPYAYYYVGDHLLQQGDSLNRVAGLAMAAMKFMGKDRRGFKLMGDAYMAMGKYKLAKSSYRRGVKVLPEDAELNFLLGKAYFHMGETKSAGKYLRNSLKLVDHELTAGQKEEAQNMIGRT